MADTYVEYTGDGTTRDFVFSFPYLNTEHVKVSVNDAETEDFELISIGTVRLDTAPANAAGIRVFRETPRTGIIDFVDGSVLLESDLDLGYLQTLYVTQEAYDNLGASAVDAITEQLEEAAGYAAAASDSADDAEGFKDQTETLKNETQTLRDEAEGFKDDAEAAAASLSGLLIVSANDTTPGNLESKLLVAGTPLELSTQNEGGNETRTITLNIASQVEAEAGAATNKVMTPQRTAQAIAALTPAPSYPVTSVNGQTGAVTVSPGKLISRSYAEYTSASALSTTIPFDDTPPTIAEGTEVLSASITPGNTANRIRVYFSCFGACASSSAQLIAAIFSGSTLRQASVQDMVAGFDAIQLCSYVEFEANTTSALTISVRVGASSGNCYLNADFSGTRKFGGSSRATLIIEEVTP